MSLLKRTRGRPKKIDARKTPFTVKLNDKEKDQLVYLMEELGLSTSEVLRLALDKLYKDT